MLLGNCKFETWAAEMSMYRSRLTRYPSRSASFLGAISGDRLKDFWAQDAEVVGKAAVRAGLNALDGKEPEKVKMLYQSDIVKLGKAS